VTLLHPPHTLGSIGTALQKVLQHALFEG